MWCWNLNVYFQLKLFCFYVAAQIWWKDNWHCIKRCQDSWAATSSSRCCQEHHFRYCSYCCHRVCLAVIQACYDQSQHIMAMLTLIFILNVSHHILQSWYSYGILLGSLHMHTYMEILFENHPHIRIVQCILFFYLLSLLWMFLNMYCNLDIPMASCLKRLCLSQHAHT